MPRFVVAMIIVMQKFQGLGGQLPPTPPHDLHVAPPLGLLAFWLILQLVLHGARSSCVYMGQLDFFIRKAPNWRIQLQQAFYLSTLFVGFILGNILSWSIKK
jgi:hypothetical protein